ncbi:hypothetical protein [Beggiatoa leptomitoformis]|uniref:Uncharacterized protein n=1 Tax=Beggiatoa leptomitoformis TaxID=288004 RepID=A0A2N9YC71_9GAMM|nr:hypothetical protein [Beggiatoa leptomitoformis]ALG66626.1 hypothetical protein AL038_01355 [Beggiatoa leptomitoformis]AUI68063.1 hypothetical protein BLE401_04670 [Beggiatoa leptomitoformis]
MTLLKQQTVGLIMISALIFSASVSAGFVEDSYIVVFQPSLGMTPSLISPPIKANRGKVPFGKHSSKQDKAALSKELGINGEVVAIFDTINAAHIKMSAKEAYRVVLKKP